MIHLNFNYFPEHTNPPTNNKEVVHAAYKVSQAIEEQHYQFFNVLEDVTLQEQILYLSQHLHFDNFVILGTGGSSLGGETLCAMHHNPFVQNKPALFFVDNIDPRTIKTMVHSLDLAKTYFIIISKSGTTPETLMQALCVMHALKNKDLRIQDHCLVITEPKDSPLSQLADLYSILKLPHDTKIGGRFSIFSIVGLLPAALSGLNIKEITHGAKSYLQAFQKHQHHHPAAQGACLLYSAMQNGKPMSVMMPYVDALEPFSAWYAQLWAESLGKAGQGSTPIKALGTVDQHSQLQLYYDGPKDKYFTFIIEETAGKGPIGLGVPSIKTLDELSGLPLGDLMAIEAQATLESLANAGCDGRSIRFKELTPLVMGQLLMHFMLETIITAELMHIDAFNQPGVEDSKIKIRTYLRKRTQP